MEITLRNVPEVGQTALVRGRPYIVEEVRAQAADPEPVASALPQHLARLACLDENSLDERLEVIWELEPGAEIREKSSLPAMKRFDDPADLDAFLHAVRWGIVSQMDRSSMQAPLRSGVDVEDYQLEPVARALTMPRVNLLLADDVGLGKTIEAGLVMRELMLRNRANTVLVVCPSALQWQWMEEMRDKFGLEFRIIDSAAVSRLRRQRGIHVNPWTHFPRLITSIDYFKQERVFRRFRETLPVDGRGHWPRRYDLLIVDEAHNIAPSGTARYVRPSQRTDVVRRIAPHFEHRLFLTATPHNGYSMSFSALLEILDDQRFVRGVMPAPETLGQVMVRRMKTEIVNPLDNSPRFPTRNIQPLPVNYTDEEREIHRVFGEYARLCHEHAERPEGFGRDAPLDFILKLLKKRLFSSPRAFCNSIERHMESRLKKNALAADAALFRRLADLDDCPEEELAEDVESALESSGALLSPLQERESALLDAMRRWGRKYVSRADAKAGVLLRWLHENLRPGGEWTDERVVIFTEYRDTQDYLAELITREKMGGERLACLNGGTSPEDREKIKAAFQASPKDSPVRILLGTDAASEGINLQNHCSRLIHYEIPWNPSRLEQRNGRIDRHGQQAASVDVYHFVCAAFTRSLTDRDSLENDMEFLRRVVRKVENIRLDLGKVGPVIARQVEKAMLSGHAAGPLDTDRAERDAASARAALKLDRDLKKTLREAEKKLADTRNALELSPDNLRETIGVALRLAGQAPLEPAHVDGIPDGQAWTLPPLTRDWAECRAGVAHPFTGAPRPVVFDAALAQNRDDVALVHLNHLLARMSLRLLRSQLWAPELDCVLHRVAARVAPPGHDLAHPVVVALGRVIVVGGSHQRIFEEMIMAGGTVKEKRFARMGVQELEAFWAKAAASGPARRAERLEKVLRDEVWPSVRDPLFNALQARCDERLKTLESRMGKRLEEDAARIRGVMEELRRNITAELEKMDNPQSGPYQLSLFGEDERELFNADRAVLRQRLERIPEELDGELAALRTRYGNPRQTLFPLAVVWFIPQKMYLDRGRA